MNLLIICRDWEADMKSAKLRGVYCPVLTPFDRHYNPDVDKFIRHSKNLLNQGCHGLAIFGTTGEANSLSVEERIRLLDALIKSGVPAELIAPGTGCSALTDTLTLTRHAFEAGCGGVLMLPPFYYKSVEDVGLFNSFSTIIDKIADDRLKVYLYHIPPISGIPLEIPMVKRLAECYPDNVVGLKDSSGVWSYTETLLKTLPGFGVFSGSEIFLQNNLKNNGSGTITASANVNATMIRSLFDDWSSSDSTAKQARITKIREVIQKYPLIQALKAIIANNLGDESWLNVRPPLISLSMDGRQRLLSELSQAGYSPPSETVA